MYGGSLFSTSIKVPPDLFNFIKDDKRLFEMINIATIFRDSKNRLVAVETVDIIPDPIDMYLEWT
jgi:hypothetical protein